MLIFFSNFKSVYLSFFFFLCIQPVGTYKKIYFGKKNMDKHVGANPSSTEHNKKGRASYSKLSI